MSSLVRTRIGDLSLENAVLLDDVRELAETGQLPGRLLSMNDALATMPAVRLNLEDSPRFCNGIVIPIGSAQESPIVRVLDDSGSLLAIAEIKSREDGYVLAPHKVLAESREVIAA
jgi:tRNA pseudouridine55 synthase